MSVEAVARERSFTPAAVWPAVPLAWVTVTALLLRAYAVGRSYEIHLDEITYLRIAEAINHGNGISLYGDPFYLHPPLYMVLEAMWLRLFGDRSDVVSAVQHVRALDVVLGTLTVLAAGVLVRRLAGRWAAVAAAAIVALDPFVVKFNSRNMLETLALLMVLCGYLALAGGQGESAVARRWRLFVAGICLGFALLTKELTAFAVFAPLTAAIALRWVAPRRHLLAVAGVAVATYATYPLAVLASGQWDYFAAGKSDGILRAIGLVQTTGFHQHGASHSLVAAILSNMAELAPTYALFAVGVPATLLLLRARDHRRRLIALWTASAYVQLGYAMTFGTLEEQFFYLLAVPLGPTIVLAACELRARHPRVWLRLLLVPLALWLLGAGAGWYAVHTRPDDGYQRLIGFMHLHIDLGTRVAVTTEPAKFLLERRNVGMAASVADLKAQRAHFALVSTYEAEHGYGFASPAFLRQIEARGRLVFAFHRTSRDDTLALYRLPVPSLRCVPPNC